MREAAETKRMINIIRNFSGFREYPKYAMMKRYFLFKQALPEEAGRLVRAGVIGRKEDIYYLTLEELRDAVSTASMPVSGLAEWAPLPVTWMSNRSTAAIIGPERIEKRPVAMPGLLCRP